MNRILLSVVILFFCVAATAQGNAIAEIARENGQGRLVKVSERADRVKPDARMNSVIVRDENGVRWREGKRPIGINPAPDASTVAADAALQPESQGPESQAATVGVNVNGLGYTFVNPPDPTLAAGPNHVIQMINGGSGAYFRILNKSGGTLVNQTYLDNLTSLGGLGDPIVLYDHIADRFVMTEFANDAETGSEGLIMAVSQTADPAASWYVYFFSTGTSFPDYPKFSVWPDGYYATSNDFSPNYSGSTIYAFDRSRMLTGQTLTSYQSVKFSTTSYSKYFAMCPVLLQGATNPPAGTGGLIAYMFDDSWTSTTADRDSVGVIEFDVNWTNPNASTITNVSSLATTAFKSSICTATRGQCIPMPGTTSRLEALHQRVMNQPIYRNFNGTGGIVLSFTVDIGSSVSGIRWYELRKPATGNWSIYQQSTYGPADGIYRWMPSISYDGSGNIGLIYNVSNGTSVNPGVRYTGRLANDPLNTMTEAEGVIVNGNSRNGSTRYGDYNHLTADPAGTLWMTAQWNNTTQWSTRIASFTLSGGAVTCDAPTGLNETNITETSATLNWNAVSGANNYTVEYKPASSGTWLTGGTPTDNSFNLSGLTAGTNYDWRVRSNCASSSSAFLADQFTTSAAVVCNPPSNLNETNIAETAATLNWDAVSGANNYTVEYKAASSGTWLLAGTPSANSFNLSSLATGTAYDWRVRSNCASGNSAFVSDQFTTLTPATCDAPTGLASSGITNTSANLSWTAASGAVSYTVQYKESSSGTWLNATTTSATSYALGGLNAGTAYDWRVRTNCATLNSAYTTATFTTQNVVTCTDVYEPNNNSASAADIAVNATISALICDDTDVDWYAFSNNKQNKTVTVTLTVPAGVNYDFRLYQPNGNVVGTTSGTASSKTLSYDGNPTGRYLVEVFSTTGSSTTATYSLATAMSNGPLSCDPPTGLNEGNITENSATLGWNAVGGANSYTVEYKPASTSTWLAAGTPSGSSFNLSGLSAGTNYDWRVRSNCSGSSSIFAADQFTTASTGGCDAPTGLASSGITSSSANLSWSAAGGALSYTVEYKESSSANWLNATTTSATSFTLGGLNAATAYDWRVRTNCATLNSAFASASFTTPGLVTCTDAYEPNNSSASAADVPVNSTISALICDDADVDWYAFTNDKQNKTVTVTLTIPVGVNYDFRLYQPNGNLAVSSSGTAKTKSLSFSGNPTGRYLVEVYSTTGSSITDNYSLNMAMGSGNAPDAKEPIVTKSVTEPQTDNALLMAFPNPATNMLNLSFIASQNGKADIKLVDMQGRIVSNLSLGVSSGRVNTTLNVGKLHGGMYVVQVLEGGRVLNTKVSIIR